MINQYNKIADWLIDRVKEFGNALVAISFVIKRKLQFLATSRSIKSKTRFALLYGNENRGFHNKDKLYYTNKHRMEK
jgi:hypothetical protein